MAYVAGLEDTAHPQRHFDTGASIRPVAACSRCDRRIRLGALLLLGLATSPEVLAAHGFQVNSAAIGELGPGDSIGLAALLSGAQNYVGLDIVPFSSRADLKGILEELARLYLSRESIPDVREFPRVRPKLGKYTFPRDLVEYSNIETRAEKIRREVKCGLNNGGAVSYRAPWNSSEAISVASLDLIFSQAVLEHVDDLEKTYSAMSAWLRPGGYASHVIDFGAHNLSPFWDGHRAYTDREWRLVRGRREFLLNRGPLSVHLRLAEQASFEILQVIKDYDQAGVSPELLAPQFRSMDTEDRRTRGCILILGKRK